MMRRAMGLLSRDRRDSSTRLIALALASGVPLAAYLATASAYGYWLDGGEFVAASVNLDIAHPPGHPIAILWGKLFCFLPLGSLAFRVALGQSVAAAIAAGFLFGAIDTTVRALGVTHNRVAIPIALGGAWLVACAQGWWFQAVRPEVYALQAMLVCIAIERVVALEAAWPTLDVRPLYVAAVALGLSFANHHLVGLLAVPAFAPTLARVYRARGLRPLVITTLALLIGLTAYVYLPVRAATEPPANLGHPSDAANLWWVVSARVYAHHMGLEAPQPLGERAADLLELLIRNFQVVRGHGMLGIALGFFALTTAIIGLYAMVRTAGVRRIGFVWAAILFVNVLARAWLGSVRSNPDILGYLLPGLAAIGACIAVCVAAVLGRIGPREGGAPRRITIAFALLFAVIGLAQLKSSAPLASLAGFHATDDFDEQRVRRLPYGAVVVAYDPQTVFRHWSVQAVERSRPDVSLVPMPFLAYPGMDEALIRRDPELRDLLLGARLDGELRQPDVQSLAARSPLMIEMDLRARPLFETVAPAPIFYEVIDGGATETDVLEGARVHETTLRHLYAYLGDDANEIETKNQLLWRHYVDAIFFASAGAREPARESVRRALTIQPDAAQLQLLDQVLSQPGSGPIDVRQFLVGSSYEE